ncbi:MAG: hypothetical protein JRI67_10665 [Deltaproteobacteria bacterium]|nr:hypothetical protein [Deltaproteobacteria bacterium]
MTKEELEMLKEHYNTAKALREKVDELQRVYDEMNKQLNRINGDSEPVEVTVYNNCAYFRVLLFDKDMKKAIEAGIKEALSIAKLKFKNFPPVPTKGD